MGRKFTPLSFFTAVVLLVGALMFVRLWQQSVGMHTYYIASAEQQQYATQEIQAQRGIIYVADTESGQPVILADSIQRYAVSATPRHVENPDVIVPALMRHLKLEPEDEQALWNKLTFEGGTNWPADKGFYTSPFAHGLTKEEIEALAKDIDPNIQINFDVAQGDLIYFSNGLFFIKEYQRIYPENDLASHILGYVNFAGEGQYGFEQFMSKDLEGSAGNVAVERDSRGRLLSQVGSVSGRNGYSYVLTVDRNIQYKAESALNKAIKDYAAESGSVVVLEAKTGNVLAMTAKPSFDPNKFFEVEKDKQSVFLNPVISSRYEFGSVFKPLVMAMAIDKGLTNPDEVGSYEGSVKIGQFTISNVEKKAYNNITMTQVLENSVNTAMMEIGNRLGSDGMYDYLEKLRFGQVTGIQLAGEETGFLLPREKMKDIQRSTISFGQGIDTTALHLATAYTAIANKGQLMQPNIIDQIIAPDGTVTHVEPKVVDQVFSEDTARQVRNMMVSVIVSGHARQAAVRGYKVSGKTGTAQIANPAGGYYDDRYRHSFIAIAPSDEPEFIVFVTLENPANAEFSVSTAAPLSGEITKYLLNYYQIPPTNK